MAQISSSALESRCGLKVNLTAGWIDEIITTMIHILIVNDNAIFRRMMIQFPKDKIFGLVSSFTDWGSRPVLAWNGNSPT